MVQLEMAKNSNSKSSRKKPFTKSGRLSLRISTLLNERIETAIELSNREIRNRSEFGTKAIEFFLNYLKNTVTEQDIIISAILKLGKELNIDLPELTKLNRIRK